VQATLVVAFYTQPRHLNHIDLCPTKHRASHFHQTNLGVWCKDCSANEVKLFITQSQENQPTPSNQCITQSHQVSKFRHLDSTKIPLTKKAKLRLFSPPNYQWKWAARTPIRGKCQIKTTEIFVSSKIKQIKLFFQRQCRRKGNLRVGSIKEAHSLWVKSTLTSIFAVKPLKRGEKTRSRKMMERKNKKWKLLQFAS